MSEDEEFIEFLRRSREQVGELEPVILTEEGRVIDGKHRLKAYPGWHKVIVRKSKKEALRERIHRTLKARVTRKERKAQILEYALYLEEDGVNPEDMVSALAKELPFSERYLRKLLPAKYKKKQMAREGKKLRNSVPQSIETPIPEAPEIGKETLEISPEPAVAPEKPSQPSIPEAPAKPLESPKPPRTVIPKAFTCPRCRVEIETLRCPKCFSILEVKEIAKILRRMILE